MRDDAVLRRALPLGLGLLEVRSFRPSTCPHGLITGKKLLLATETSYLTHRLATGNDETKQTGNLSPLIQQQITQLRIISFR